MNNHGSRYPFIEYANSLGETSWIPMLPMTLSLGVRTVKSYALLDTGASIYVLPYSVGHALGLDWNDLPRSVPLAGNLNKAETRLVQLEAIVEGFSPVELGFAWTNSDASPVILGYVNFFQLFDVCFFASQLYFQIQAKK